MTNSEASTRQRIPAAPPGGGVGIVGLLGFVGALVYFWLAADSTGERVLAILKALVWPAYLVYGALKVMLG